ncbi:MAG: hypothetical protein JO329_26575 [Planctomycetaceae bacterium]|nr:hypothetical protein [Planctomycetaceae bacterium]MBV8269470.1 hypothetical protein [Planctomycetaceae bacterium]MBV8318714.1 hypothetical protein [Planctomycetaceae bacterium]MBV8384059.1 hypothetical protein [Planctomycetaceae bacterium]MBV8606878.1 hypothetical protein [Singulisphaera sp.]
MHARTVAGLAGADPAAVALNDRQVWRAFQRGAEAFSLRGSESRRSANSPPPSGTTRSIVLAETGAPTASSLTRAARPKDRVSAAVRITR